MAFGETFTAIASDPYGEAMRVRLYVRLNDADDAPGTLVELTATQEVLALNPITRKREREFGVVQGQSWQVRITNRNKALLAYNLKDCWCCIRAGFPVADVWETFAQGKVKKATYSAGGTVTLEIHDAVMDVLNYVLPRDIRFQGVGWVSEMQIVSKGAGSSDWDSSVAIVLGAPALAEDETFEIEFTTPSAYKIILETGDESQTGTISSDKNVDNSDGETVITLPAAGWYSGSGTYAAGDRFMFYTAHARTSDQLTAVYMVAHLIDNVLGARVYDVMTGADYASPRADTSYWTAAGETAVDAYHIVQGFWPKGTSISRLVQDALKVVHGSIFPTRTGQIGLWVLAPSTAVVARLNGVPGQGQIDVLDDMTFEDDLDNAISEVVIRYKTLDGEDAVCSAADADTLLLAPRSVTIDIGWEVRGPSVQDSADKYINRYKVGIREFTVPATLTGIVAEIGAGIAFSEGELDLDAEVSDVTEVEYELLENSAIIRAHTDPVVIANYFVLDESLLGGTAVLW